MSLSKNSKIFFNIFILSPPLVVQVLYEILEIIVFIGFKDRFENLVEISIFNGIVGGGYYRGAYIYAPISPRQAPAGITPRFFCEAGGLPAPGLGNLPTTDEHYDPLGGGPPMFHGVASVVGRFPRSTPSPPAVGFRPHLCVFYFL